MPPLFCVRTLRVPPFSPSAPRRGAIALAGLAAFAAAVVLTPVVRAQSSLYWDLNGFTAGAGGGTAPSGIWNTTDTRWNALAAGNGPVVPWINNSVAVFSAGTNATGAYTVTLAANSLPVGGLSFQDGTVTLGGVGSLLLVNPAAGVTPSLSLGGSPATLGAGVTLTGFSGLNVLGSGTLTLNGQSTVLGPTLIDGVTVQLGASDRLGDASPVLLTNTGTLALAGFDERIGGLSGTGQVTLGGGTLTIDTADATTFGGTISGPGGVWKLGDGTLTLSNAVGWTGETWIGNGTLALGASNLFPATAEVAIAPSGTLSLGANIGRFANITGAGNVVLASGELQLGTNAATEFATPLSGAGDFGKVGTGVLTFSRPSPLLGTYRVYQGTLRLGADECLANSSMLMVSAGATFDLQGHTETVDWLDNNGTVQLSGGTLGLGHPADHAVDVIYGDITGPGTWIFHGPGSAELRGTFGPTGTLSIQAGTMFLGYTSQLASGVNVFLAPLTELRLGVNNVSINTLTSSGAIYLGSSRVTLAGDGDSTVLGPIEGNGGLTKSGAGTLLIGSKTTYTGPTRVLQGTVRLSGYDRLPVGAAVEIAAGAVLQVERGDDPGAYLAKFGSVTGAGDLLANEAVHNFVHLGVDGGTSTFDGRLRGSSSFRKTGLGTLTLTGSSDFSGRFEVFEGTVRLGGDDRLPFGSANGPRVESSGTLDLAGHVQHFAYTYSAGKLDLGTGGHAIFTDAGSWFGQILGVGQLTKEGTGFLDLEGGLSFSGPTHVRAGELGFNRDNTIDTDVQVDAGATLSTNAMNLTFGQLTGLGRLDGGWGLVRVGRNNGDFAFDGTITGPASGRFGKIGTGRFTLNGTSSIGNVQVEAGTVTLGADERLDDATDVQLFPGATLDLGGHQETIDALTGAGSVALAGGTLNLGAAGTTFAFDGTLQGFGTFTKLGGGTLTLTSAQNFNGTLRVSGGALGFDLAGVSPFSAADIAAGATLNLPAGATLGGTVQNDGTVDFGGGAPVTLTGAVSGAGRFKGAAVFAGSFSPGNVGGVFVVSDFSNVLTFAASHTLRLDLGGTAPGASHDQVRGAAAVTLGGKLQVTLRNGFVPAAGQSFTLFAAPTLGKFAQYDLPPLPHGLAWDTSLLASDGKLRVLGGYAAFVASFGLDPATDGAPLANPSGDGVANVLKYLLGGNPLVAQPGLVPAATVENAGATTTLVFAYDRDIAAAADLASVGVEWSADLTTWTTAVPGAGGVTQQAFAISLTMEHVVTRIPIAGPRGFARLRVEL